MLHLPRARSLTMGVMALGLVGASVAIGALNSAATQGRLVTWAIVGLGVVFAGLLVASLFVTDQAAAGRPLWPIYLYLAAQIALASAMMLLSATPTAFSILFIALAAQLMALLPVRIGWIWIAALSLAGTAILIYHDGWLGGLLSSALFVGAYLLFGIFARTVVEAESAQRRSQALADQLQEANTRLQAYATRIEELAVVEERGRLAREMHDTLGHHLTVAAVQLEGAHRLIPTDPDRAAAMIGTVRDQVREALAELRRAVAALSTPLEADLSLTHSLARLAASFEQATGLAVHQLLPDALPPLPGPHRLAVYRAAQEALTNVQRHACAGQVWLELSTQDQSVTLRVGDDGKGLSLTAGQPGYGLRGLRERAAQLGGELHVEPRRGGGTELSFRLPVEDIGD